MLLCVCLQIVLYLFLLVLSWLIPNPFYEVYVHIARVISGIFLFLQILILLDFAISWAEDWVPPFRPRAPPPPLSSLAH